MKTNQQKARVPALNVQNFPPHLHMRFKALATLNGLSVRAATIQAVDMWVKAHMDSGVAALPGLPEEAEAAREVPVKVRQRRTAAR